MKRLAIASLALLVWASVALALGARYGQTSVTVGTPVLVGDATGRRGICWKNTDATNPIYCSNVSNVTSATGMPISAGDRYCISDPSAVDPLYCVATGGTVVVGYRENIAQ